MCVGVEMMNWLYDEAGGMAQHVAWTWKYAMERIKEMGAISVIGV